MRVQKVQMVQKADINLGINIDFQENSPFQEGIISEMYQRPNELFFHKP